MGDERGIDGFVRDLQLQGGYFVGRIPVYARLAEIIADLCAGPLGARLDSAWRGRRFFIFYDRPLLLLAALRHDALLEGPSHRLWSSVVANSELPAVEAVEWALERERVWASLTTRTVQTNETSRAIAWRWPALLAGWKRVALVDIGCSAGLNLVADALPAPWTVDGKALAFPDSPDLAARVGFDLNPLDVRDADSAAWLRAAIWPGQDDRLIRLDNGIAAMRAALDKEASDNPPVLVPLRAADIPAHLAGLDLGGVRVLAYQTVMREYLPPDERAAYLAGMEAWLRETPRGRAMWIELEAGGEGATADLPAALHAHVRGAGSELLTLKLARCAYHPAALVVDEDAVRDFSAALRAPRGTT